MYIYIYRWACRRSFLRVSHRPLKGGPAMSCRSLLSVCPAASGASHVRHPAALRPGTAPACRSHRSRQTGFCDSARSCTSGTCKAAVPARRAPALENITSLMILMSLHCSLVGCGWKPKGKLARGTTALTCSHMRQERERERDHSEYRA